jgi:hypothetical protein
MRYLILVYGDAEAEEALGPDGRRAIMHEHLAFSARLRERDALVDGDALEPTAWTLRGGLVTDGPFAETKEQLGGYYLLECADLDEALGWAKQVPAGPGLVVEVRPLAGVGS